jgi:hypothetical protein
MQAVGHPASTLPSDILAHIGASMRSL